MTTADYLISSRSIRKGASNFLRGALNAMKTHAGAHETNDDMLRQEWIKGAWRGGAEADRQIQLNTERANTLIEKLRP